MVLPFGLPLDLLHCNNQYGAAKERGRIETETERMGTHTRVSPVGSCTAGEESSRSLRVQDGLDRQEQRKWHRLGHTSASAPGSAAAAEEKVEEEVAEPLSIRGVVSRSCPRSFSFWFKLCREQGGSTFTLGDLEGNA